MNPEKYHNLPEVLRKQLSETHIVRISVDRADSDPLAFNAPVRLISPLWMEVFLSPDTSPLSFSETDFPDSLMVMWERGENAVTLLGQPACCSTEGWLRVKIMEITLHPIRRRFPRVDTEVDLRFWPANMGRRTVQWALARKVSISGSGIRFLAGDNFAVGRQLDLEISFPETAWSPVHCLGEIVNVEIAPTGGYWLAMEIVSMTRPNLDALMQFCMAEQFRQLQLKVNCLGSVLAPGEECTEMNANHLENNGG